MNPYTSYGRSSSEDEEELRYPSKNYGDKKSGKVKRRNPYTSYGYSEDDEDEEEKRIREEWERSKAEGEEGGSSLAKILGGIGKVGKAVGEDFSKRYRGISEGVAEALAFDTGSQKGARESQSNLLESNNKIIGDISEKLKNPKLGKDQRERLERLMGSLLETNNETQKAVTERSEEIVERTDPREAAGNVVGIGADVLSGGSYGALAKGANTGRLARGGAIARAGMPAVSKGREAVRGAAIGAGIEAGGSVGRQAGRGEGFDTGEFATDVGLGSVLGSLSSTFDARSLNRGIRKADEITITDESRLLPETAGTGAPIAPESRQLTPGAPPTQVPDLAVISQADPTIPKRLAKVEAQITKAQQQGGLDATQARTLMKEREQLIQEAQMTNGQTPDPITVPSPPRGEAAQGPLSTPLKQPIDSNTPAGAVATPEAPKSDIDLINEKLKEAFNVRAVQNTRRSRALGERVRAATQASRGLKGAEADRAVLKQMKGALPKEEWNGLSDTLNVDEQTALFNRLHEQITTNPDLDFFQQRIRGPEALGKLIYGQGGVPQPNEIKLLGKVFGEEFAENLAVQARVFTKPNYATQILGAPKAMKATADLSMGFRQGAALGVRYPKAFKNAMTEQVKYLKNPKYYQAEMDAIGKRPNAELYKKMGIDLSGVDEFSVTEEQFMSTILEGKVSKKLGYGHVVAGSNRAFTGGLTRLRADAADSILDNLRRAGKLDAMTDVELKGLGDFINSASGRGKMYKMFERNGELLSNALFSPRLWASRVNLISPAYYKSLPPQARMLAIQTAGLYATAVGGVLALAKMGGAEVEMDPRSADFAKIKFGNTRYDIAGGFQQNIVFLARLLSGGVKSTSTGEVSSLTDDTYGGRSRLSVIGDLLSNKANPLISALMVQISGEDRMGNDINRGTELAKMTLPIGVENIGETYGEARDVQGKSGAQAALTSGLKAVPETFGIGTQTYGLNPLRGKQAELFEGQPREKQLAFQSFLKTAKAMHQPTIRKKVDAAVADKQFEKARRLATEYNLTIEDALEEMEGQTGPLPEEIRDYLRSNYQISYDYYVRKGKKANR